ncbi:MAG: FAD-dependent oxidoreductase [Marivita sp.]|uniref:NAD(P)/FAD-dependent oxidoreductase n=1 Tax=Marivita sp. TaxID=2003365 RepID=UPI001B00A206|nr:FAD-dependent oxidoreductase [Marivita sp.]MBO6883752.1 FAD-dependent oxidoreductase [Marivita sp.]
MKIAIIGSGMSGLACANRLSKAGLTPTVFDKGRGIGGRMATRRADGGFQFDHGAQIIPSETEGFRALLEEAKAAGHVADWDSGDGKPHVVGTPGMTALTKYLAHGLDLHQQTEVTSVTQTNAGWELTADQPLGIFDHVVCTAPVPQTNKLVGPALSDPLDRVVYAPSLTLMVALKRPLDAPATQTNPTDALAWIAHDSAKPGRSTENCWVAQASADWSATHLELSKDEIATRMLDLFLTHHRLDATDVAYATAHRWRYALVTEPLGQPYVKSHDGTLYAGGDWCLGPRIEHAWQSGTAIADDILRSA